MDDQRRKLFLDWFKATYKGEDAFAYYFTPPFGWAALFSIVCWIAIPAPEGKTKASVHLPLRGITIAVAAMLVFAYLGRGR